MKFSSFARDSSRQLCNVLRHVVSPEDRRTILTRLGYELSYFLCKKFSFIDKVLVSSTNKDFDFLASSVIHGLKLNLFIYDPNFVHYCSNRISTVCFWNHSSDDGFCPITRISIGPTGSLQNPLAGITSLIYVKSPLDKIRAVEANLQESVSMSNPKQVFVIGPSISGREKCILDSSIDKKIYYIHFVDKFDVELTPEMIGVNEDVVPVSMYSPINNKSND